MSAKHVTRKDLDSWIAKLASEDGATRLKARTSLEALGKPAVPPLRRALQRSRSDHVRWEAVKTLGSIGDPRAIPALVKGLEDPDPDVRWLAAEALRKFKHTAWPSLLRALIRSGPESVLLRQAAYHVVRNQREERFNTLLAALRRSLEFGAAPISTKMAAYNLLSRIATKP